MRTGADRVRRPSTIGRSTGVSLRSTSHRPSSPKAWRAMPRYRPGAGCPVRSRPGVPRPPRANPARTSEPSGSAASFEPPVGVATRRVAACLGSAPGKPECLPESDGSSSRAPGPLRRNVRSPVRGTPSRIASPQVKGEFSIHRVLPRTFPLPPGHRSSSTGPAQGCAQMGVRSPARRSPVAPFGLTIGARPGFNGARERHQDDRGLSGRSSRRRDHHHFVSAWVLSRARRAASGRLSSFPGPDRTIHPADRVERATT